LAELSDIVKLYLYFQKLRLLVGYVAIVLVIVFVHKLNHVVDISAHQAVQFHLFKDITSEVVFIQELLS